MAAKTHDEFCNSQKNCPAVYGQCLICEVCWNAAIASMEAQPPAPNSASRVICANNICDYCQRKNSEFCCACKREEDHYGSYFVGRKLQAVA
jgi:hypothetical protein